MELKELILNSLTHHEVIEKIAEHIRDELINNQNLNENEIDDLEVLNSKNNSGTLLKDYSSLELAIEDVIERELLSELNKDEIEYEM
ncbi:hypothetical protein [Spiroplasma floricola]|uniref:Uncharacterized protein n=1 Tax=Spiroplasma floricola 23-6 TaxID=1336749 RepID=A0A2K8SF76_9MOLU|nr:hypothetical protein [Spiroplasma floricola]AUB32005.1 hypothetical protein SFLOR_v1c09570 [Spiroplasma floricola 23-6]